MGRMTDTLDIPDPFSISPNPLYLYQTPSTRATLHKIRYTINRRQGLTAILGGVGVGKSTLLRFLYTEFDASDPTIARFIPTPSYSTEFAFLKAVCAEFDLPARGSLLAQETTLRDFLIAQYSEKRNVVLFVDEAQRLSNKMLELVRAMLNFETNRVKLIQIVLSGQLQLLERLVTEDMEAIESRIVMPTVLNALNRVETEAMLEHRCKVADVPFPFTRPAIDRVYAETGGVARDILKICAVAYEFMVMSGETSVDEEMLETAIGEGSLKLRARMAATHG